MCVSQEIEEVEEKYVVVYSHFFFVLVCPIQGVILNSNKTPLK